MNKYALTALSLIAAVPGGYLCYLLVMVMLDHFRDMPGLMKTLVSGMVAVSALVAVLPLGILIFVRSEKEEAEAETEEEGEAAAEEEEAEVAGLVEEEAEIYHTGDEVEVSDTDWQEPVAGGEDLEESVVIEPGETGDDFDFFDEEEAEEEKS